MNQTRSFLLIAWLFVAAWLLIQWTQGPKAPAAEPAPVTASASTSASSLPQLPAAASGTTMPLPATAAAAAAGTSAAATASSSPSAAQPIILANDRLRLAIDPDGGRIVNAQLLQYRVEKKADSPNVVLLDDTPGRTYTADAGVIVTDAARAQHELPLHFRATNARGETLLPAGAESVSTTLEAIDPATGLKVRRTLTLRRGSYVVELQDAFGNGGAQPLSLNPFVRLSRIAPPPPPKHSFATNPDSFSFVGTAWYTGSSFEKTPFKDYSDEAPPSDWVKGAWISMLQHHFLTAWVPAENEQQVMQTGVATLAGQPLYQIRSAGATVSLAPGASATHSSKLWVGPKLQAPMKQLAPQLTLAVDYGVLAFISRPLFWLLSLLHQLIGNWGWAIIAIVVVLKALLYWPSKKQYQSMAKMRAVMPRIEALKERYGDDKQALNVAMFELYKKEKVNPAAGCWPILVQMPIFLGLYWVLIETVELRQQPWMGWIQNLTAPDPWFVLPALNLAVMYLTQKMTPTPGMDPMQRKMMQMMPLVFGVMMAFFPAGLVLYWVTNGSLGLLQQWWMLRRYGQKPAAGTAVSR